MVIEKGKKIVFLGAVFVFLLVPIFYSAATVSNTRPFNDEIGSTEDCNSMDSKDCYPVLYINETNNFQAYGYKVDTYVTQAFGSSAYIRADVCTTQYGWGSNSADCKGYVAKKVSNPESFSETSQINLGDLRDYNAVSVHVYVNNVYSTSYLKTYGRRVYIDYLTPTSNTAKTGDNIYLSWRTTNTAPSAGGTTLIWSGTSDGGGSFGVPSSDPNWGPFTRNTAGTAYFTLRTCGPEGYGPDCVEVTQQVDFYLSGGGGTPTPIGQLVANPNSCNQRCNPLITWSTTNATKTYTTMTGPSPDGGGRYVTSIDSAANGSVTDTGSEGIGLKEGSYTYNLYAKNNSIGYALIDSAAIQVGPSGGTPPPAPPPGAPPPPTGINCVEDATIVSPANGSTITLGMGETYFLQPTVKNGNNTDQTKWYAGTLSIYRFHKRSGVPTISPSSRSPGSTVYKNDTWTMNRGFTITAPSTPGTYPLEMQMMHVGTPPVGSDYIRSKDNKKCTYPPPETTERGFGETLILNVLVTPAPTPVPPDVDLDVKKIGDSSYSESSINLTWAEANANPAISLNWTTTATVTSCTASGDWSGSKSASGGTESLGNLTSKSTFTYVINCDGGTTSSVTVNVGPRPAPTVDIKANNSDGPITLAWNSSANLSWTSTNADSCVASGDWSGSKSVGGGSEIISSITSNRTYSITCSGNGNVSDSVSVTVSGPTVTISANPTSVAYGGSSTISWTSTSAGSCMASGDWSGNKTLSGSQSTGALNQARTYSYTLTCSGNGSDSKSATVGVSFPVPNNPSNITVAEPDYCMSGPAATVGWTYSDPSGSPQSAYQVQITNTGSFNNPILDTGKLNSGSTSYFTGQGILQFNITYKARVRVWNGYDMVSGWSNSSNSWKTPTYPYPQVDFNWTANGILNNPSPPLDKPVQFTDTTVFNGNPNGRKWSWAFGDGGSSTIQNPSHTYAAENSYYVTLTATDNANQSCTRIKGPLIIQKPIPKWREVAPR